MNSITDPEFGEITIRRSALSRAISIRVAPDGRLRASLPSYAGVGALKRMLNSSRGDIAKLMAERTNHAPLQAGMTIGKSHTLILKAGTTLSARLTKSQLEVSVPSHLSLSDPQVETFITPYLIRALRQQAKAYLPRRLEYLAGQHGFTYESARFSHASSRWGSCSSHGTISLNIALMKLPFELIDYVIFHELSHLQNMNHSPAFWSQVESLDPYYREHRRALKAHNPSAYV